jgi:hypothetical protein
VLALEALLEIPDAHLGVGGATAGPADLGDRLPVQQKPTENPDLFLAAEEASFLVPRGTDPFPRAQPASTTPNPAFSAKAKRAFSGQGTR